jgi:hypothetical protein
MLFGFGVLEPHLGEMIVRAVPLVYTMEDRALLAGIIRHELRHAADFVSVGGNISGMGGANQEIAFTNPDLYIRSIQECRAFSDQLNWLLKTMGGNSSAVLRAIKSSKFFGMSPDFAKVAEYFLDGLVKQQNEDATPPPHPTLVSKAPKAPGLVDEQAHQILSLLSKIINKMRFSNFVHAPDVSK